MSVCLQVQLNRQREEAFAHQCSTCTCGYIVSCQMSGKRGGEKENPAAPPSLVLLYPLRDIFARAWACTPHTVLKRRFERERALLASDKYIVRLARLANKNLLFLPTKYICTYCINRQVQNRSAVQRSVVQYDDGRRTG